MATLTATCDDCGVKLKGGEIYTDYDCTDRCLKCNLEQNLFEVKRNLAIKKYRLNDRYTWECESKIVRIEKELEKLNA